MYPISLLFIWLTFFVIVTSGDSISSIDDGTYCDGIGWVAYRDEKCYKLIKGWATRDEAKDVCAQEGSDGSIPQLATIKSLDEQTYLTEFVFNTSAVKFNVWIGAKRTSGNNKNFEWDDSTELGPFTNWADTSPTEELDRECVVMQSRLMKDIKNLRTVNGKWRDVTCDSVSYVICEKLPRWSFSRLQQALLNQRKELDEAKSELTDTKSVMTVIKNELTDTRKELTDTRKELTDTRNKLTDTSIDLTDAKRELTDTRMVLIDTRLELTNTRNELTETKTELTNTRNVLTSSLEKVTSELDHTKRNPVPIGFIYVQLSGQYEPSILWPNVQWQDVTSGYAGLFFRAEGGDAAQFGTVQEGNAPRVTQVRTHWFSNDQPGWGTTELNFGGWSSGVGVYSGSWIAGSTQHYALQFFQSSSEVRPRNMAIRVWKRIG